MTEEQKAEIARLAGIAHDTEERLQALRVRNVAHMSPAEKRQAAMDFAVAEAEDIQARSNLKDAMCPRPGYLDKIYGAQWTNRSPYNQT